MKNLITFAFILSICFHCSAQLSLVRIDTVQVTDQSAPLTNAWAGGLNYSMFCEMDLNGDGIMDLVIYENGGQPGHNRIMPFINNGTPGQVDYHYAPQYISCFPAIRGWMVTYDYNKDGRMDLFTLNSDGIMAYRNDFTPGTSLKFTLVSDKLTYPYRSLHLNIFANEPLIPAFADIDNDGDMDVISWPSNPDGSLICQRGLAVDSGWSLDSLRFNESECWGQFILESRPNFLYNQVRYFGTNCNGMDINADRNMKAGGTSHSGDHLLLLDINGDGLQDALIGDIVANNILLVVNGGKTGKDSMVSQDINFPSYDKPVNLASFPYAFFLDVDNDGAKDLVVTPRSDNNFRGILFYKNTGTTNLPVFALQPKTLLQEDMIDVGSAAAPVLFDYDGDGIPDLLIGDESYRDTSGNDHKGIALYKNTGTLSHPQFHLMTRDYAGIDALFNSIPGSISPTFGDLDGDGDADMIIGTGNGQLQYFQNTAGAGNPANFTLSGIKYAGIQYGQYSAPQLYDLNHDGLLDLIVGNDEGFIKYYQNTGTINNPVFTSTPTKDTLGGILTWRLGGVQALSDTSLLSGYASPFFYNDNGVDKLILGTQVGKVYVFDNISGNISGSYHLADSLINGEEGQRLVPYIGDVNHDGHPDMLVGNYNGGLSLYINTDTIVLSASNNTPVTVKPSFEAFPNPASDIIHLTFYHFENSATIELLNAVGLLIYKTVVTEHDMAIPLKNVATGIYLLRFVSNTNTQSQKIIVDKR